LKIAILSAVVSLSLLAAAGRAAGPSNLNSSFARVSLVTLSGHATLSFHPVSNQGFILVAIKDCSVVINGQRSVMKTGGYKRVTGGQNLALVQTDSKPISLVLVKVVSTAQSLTVEATKLESHEELEDASDQNATLLIAINSMQLDDVRDLAGEDEHWKSGPKRTLQLLAGQNAWLKPGIHRLRNSGNTEAQFVTVEW